MMHKFLSVSVFTAFLFANLISQTRDSFLTVFTDTVYFEFAKHTLTTDTEKSLQIAVDRLLANTRRKALITAHTDDVGSETSNLLLSERRAKSIYQYFIDQNVDSSKVEIMALGNTTPLVKGTTEFARKINRRATIEITQNFRFGEVTGQITDSETKDGLKGKVILESPILSKLVETDENGNFITDLPIGVPFQIQSNSENFFFHSFEFTLRALNDVLPSISGIPVRIGDKLPLKNIYFVGNQAVVLPRSTPQLKNLLRFMEYNQNVKIEIAGHVNVPGKGPVDPESDYFKLSVDRAKMVYLFLIENDISPERMEYKGYGNSQMLYPNAMSEEHQSQNRRVEIRFLENKMRISQE
jgi:outer membrane protein OmpA-like peptidoglycan-associated protein